METIMEHPTMMLSDTISQSFPTFETASQKPNTDSIPENTINPRNTTVVEVRIVPDMNSSPLKKTELLSSRKSAVCDG